MGRPIPAVDSGRDEGNPDGGSATSDCQGIAVQNGASVGGYNSDVYTWFDSSCRQRTAALVRNDAPDPGGSRGGYLRLLTYQVDGQTRSASESPAPRGMDGATS